MYDPELVRPMREELTSLDITELRTAADVDRFLSNKEGTALIVVNSVCGCAAGAARPGIRIAPQHDNKPTRVGTVFAGQDKEATDRARSYFIGYPSSSPQIALFKDGQLVHMLERQDIEGRSAEAIAAELRTAFDKYCAPAS